MYCHYGHHVSQISCQQSATVSGGPQSKNYQCQSVSVGVPISDIGEVEITEVGACRLIIQLCTL